MLSLLSMFKDLKKQLEKEAQKVLIELYPHVEIIKNDMKGVGYALLLELIPVFLNSKGYTLKQLQSFVGLSPRIFESGSSVYKKERISKRGSSLVRKLLYMSAMVSLRFNPIIKEKYDRMVLNGKEKMVAL
ncbi:MAG: IS110 family transposase, partial [Alphaproteobacteria bacterium]|nr:IS110 family transposase [Alphaproteobacteria bacterium]